VFSNAINSADKKFGKQHETITPRGLPRSYNEARRVLIDGRHSVFVNFPAPSVFTIDNHACVSLKQTILISYGMHPKVKRAKRD
jgi:hypothetical protein